MTTHRYLFLNQMAGPLFRELAEGLAENLQAISTLYTGHPDSLKHAGEVSELTITKGPVYNRKNKLTRILSWISYSVLAFFKIIVTSSGTTIFLVSNPPILAPLALLACKLRRLEYVILVYDIHPDTMISFGVLKSESIVVSIWRKVNKKVYENAKAVITIGDVMAETLLKQFDVNKTKSRKVIVVPPWADTDFIKPIKKSENPLVEKYNLIDKKIVLYSGNMGISHDIDSMLEAAKSLQRRSDIHFMFIGEGARWQFAVDFVKQNSLKNVTVLPFQDESLIPYTMTLSDISLVALDEGAEGLMVPSKMYYYMAAGSAIVGICIGENDLGRGIELAKCGRTVSPGDYEALKNAIINILDEQQLLTKYKENARDASLKYFSRSVCMANLTNQLNKVN